MPHGDKQCGQHQPGDTSLGDLGQHSTTWQDSGLATASVCRQSSSRIAEVTFLKATALRYLGWGGYMSV